MDHFLIQDSEVFPVLEAKPEADLPAEHHCSCERPPFLLLFPESPFPPLFYSARMGTISCEMMDVCRCLKPKASVAAVTPSLLWDPFLLFGIPTLLLPVWTTMVEQESPSNCFLVSWVGTCHVLFQKQRWTWWWDFMVLLMDCYTPGTKWVKEAFWGLAQNLTTMFLGQIDS